jgi:hypothetical protein
MAPSFFSSFFYGREPAAQPLAQIFLSLFQVTKRNPS